MSGLFDPLVVGQLHLKNRVVMAPCAVGLADKDGFVTWRSIEHYVARARGGVGLVIVESTAVEALGSATKKGHLMIYDDKYVPGLAKLTQAVKENGAKIALQIAHAGGQSMYIPEGKQAVSPSSVPSPGGRYSTPRALATEEVKQFVRYFADGARRAKEAGFDAIQLHGCHGYLINQFMSPYYNKRTDEYGGSFENRMRFVLEIIAECKKVVGDDFPMLVRISADEWLEGGMKLPDSQRAAKVMVDAGVHIIDVSAGSANLNAPKRREGEGWMLPLAEGIKQAINAPTIAVGCISTPEFADRIVRENRADLVALGRALLFNPNWANEAAQQLGVGVA